jgi:hypothetical protein
VISFKGDQHEGIMSESDSLSAHSSLDAHSKDPSSSTDDFSNSSGAYRNKDIPEEIGANESRAVVYSRIVFLAVLLIVATAAAVITYIFSGEEENKNFESQVRVCDTRKVDN